MGGGNYTNKAGYMNEQAVSDKRIVTANGTGYLEFAKELLLLLENDTPEQIEMFYCFNKEGLVKLFSHHLDSMDLSDWFKGFEKGIARPHRTTSSLFQNGKELRGWWCAFHLQETHKDANGDMDVFFQMADELPE